MDSTGGELLALMRDRIAARWLQALSTARQRLEAARQEVQDLEAAQGTLAWEVEGTGTVYLNLAGGRATAEDAPGEKPFMTVVQSRADWDRFTAGTVRTGFMSGGGKPLGASRIERLRTVRGAVRFVITELPGGEDLTTTVYFGGTPRSEPPRTTIRAAAATVEQIQNGVLTAQAAFMQGRVRIEGDMGLAVQLGAVLSA